MAAPDLHIATPADACGAATAQLGDLLDRARAQLRRRTPRQAYEAMSEGAILVDTRPEFQRRAEGEIPGAVVIERNHLEWRCSPTSPARIPEAVDHDVIFIVLCDEGYSSSLAAASLQDLGLLNATDVIGGFQAWRAARLPIERPVWPTPPRLATSEFRSLGSVAAHHTDAPGESRPAKLRAS